MDTISIKFCNAARFRSAAVWGIRDQPQQIGMQRCVRFLAKEPRSCLAKKSYVSLRFVQRLSLTLTLSRWEREHRRPRVGSICDIRRSSTKVLAFSKGGDRHSLSQRERARVRESRSTYLRFRFFNPTLLSTDSESALVRDSLKSYSCSSQSPSSNRRPDGIVFAHSIAG